MPFQSSRKPDLEPIELDPEKESRIRTIVDVLLNPYHLLMEFELPTDRMLEATARAYDRVFASEGVPLDRLGDILIQSIRDHGPYPNKAHDFVKAWRTLKSERATQSQREDTGRKRDTCRYCKGSGYVTKSVPLVDIRSVKSPEDVITEDKVLPCPYGHSKPSPVLHFSRNERYEN